MRVPFFDLKSQYALIQNEVDEAHRAIFSAAQFVGGESVHTFENQFAKKLGVSHCISVGNGTDALFVALKAAGIGPGDEVITPAWSWISSSETISLTGAQPVFADADDFFTIDPIDVERRITPRTKAIVVVHLYGQPANMDALVAMCQKRNLTLIEDCAQAHFSEYKNQMAGTFGQLAAFSFYPTKNLGAYGDGGAVVTNNSSLAEKTRRFANHGGLSKDDHQIEGINSRLDTLQAAYLTVKLNHIDAWTRKRIANAELYTELLKGVGDIVTPEVRRSSKHTFHLYVIQTKKRDALKAYLQGEGVETLVHYPKALPFEPAYHSLSFSEKDFPRAAQFQREVLSLPIYPELTREQIQFVCDRIQQFYGR
ncbi:MAG: DegT/DnrJ/EryC1/StrS family aminotransferase [Bacteroidota bacterium]